MAKGVVIAVLIIAVGVAYLLNTLHFIGGVDWVWTLSLAAVGVVSFGLMKFNKLSFVVGSFLIMGSLFSILRQTGVLSIEVEVPVLIITFGILFLVAQLPAIPVPAALVAMKEAAANEKNG